MHVHAPEIVGRTTKQAASPGLCRLAVGPLRDLRFAKVAHVQPLRLCWVVQEP